MNGFPPMIPATLHTLFSGELEEQFQKILPTILGNLKEGQSGSITINLTFKRPQDSETMVGAGFSITPRFPKTQKTALCQFVNGQLRTEAPTEQVRLFRNGDLYETKEGTTDAERKQA
jgi:hypothetical protein